MRAPIKTGERNECVVINERIRWYTQRAVLEKEGRVKAFECQQTCQWIFLASEEIIM
jgi:hypothetical protein